METRASNGGVNLPVSLVLHSWSLKETSSFQNGSHYYFYVKGFACGDKSIEEISSILRTGTQITTFNHVGLAHITHTVYTKRSWSDSPDGLGAGVRCSAVHPVVCHCLNVTSCPRQAGPVRGGAARGGAVAPLPGGARHGRGRQEHAAAARGGKGPRQKGHG